MRGGARTQAEKPCVGIEDVEQRKEIVLVGASPVEKHEDPFGIVYRRERGIGKILEGALAGDVILATEVSRLARSILQVLEILECIGILNAFFANEKGLVILLYTLSQRNRGWDLSGR
jgi:hypothetical protein